MKILLVSILLLTSSYSFEFLGYKSGMTKKEVIKVAYKKDKVLLPLYIILIKDINI